MGFVGELGLGHRGTPGPLSGSQSASLSNRLVFGGSWEVWKGFGVSNAWSQVEQGMQFWGLGHQERHNFQSGWCTHPLVVLAYPVLTLQSTRGQNW